MKTKSILIAALLLSTLFISCEDSGDTTKPVINLISPAEGEVLTAGDDIHFEMELSDDVALSSYKVNMHSNADGHTHSSVTRTDDEDVWTEQTWTFDDISGQRNATIHHHDIIIPSNAEIDEYHFMVYCTDQAGNESYVVHTVSVVAATDNE